MPCPWPSGSSCSSCAPQSGRTGLWWAADACHVDVAQAVIAAGADPNRSDRVRSGPHSGGLLLLACDPDPLPLLCAGWRQRAAPRRVLRARAHRGAPAQRPARGSQPGHRGASGGRCSRCRVSVRLHPPSSSSSSSCGQGGWMPLHGAAACGHAPVVRMLLGDARVRTAAFTMVRGARPPLPLPRGLRPVTEPPSRAAGRQDGARLGQRRRARGGRGPARSRGGPLSSRGGPLSSRRGPLNELRWSAAHRLRGGLTSVARRG